MKGRAAIGAAMVIASVLAFSVFAADPVTDPDAPSAAEADRPDTPLATSAFGQSLWKHGFTLALSYGGSKFTQVTGANRRSLPYGASLDVALTLDTQQAGLFEGGTFFFDGQSQWGIGPKLRPRASKVHAAVTDKYYSDRLNEVWFKQALWGDLLSLKLGKLDASNDFASSDLGGDFAAGDIASLSNVPMPTSPKTKTGIVAIVQPWSFLRLQVGAFQGNDLSSDGGYDATFEARGGQFKIAELDWMPPFFPDGYGGTYRLGVWRHTGTFTNRVRGTPEAIPIHGVGGWYASFDQTLWREAPGAEAQTLGLFLQFGEMPREPKETTKTLGGGLLLKAPFAGRPHDALGIGVSQVRVYYDELGTHPHTGETFEFFYKIQLTRWLTLQPDFQVVPEARNGRPGHASLVGFSFSITP